MTDLYPDEEGYIVDGSVIGFCKATTAITLHSGVKLSSASGVISITAGSADGDAVGVALKAGDTNDFLPVCFYGVVKMAAGAVFNEGDMVKGAAAPATVLPIDTLTHDQLTLWRGVIGAGGSAWRLGMALQAAAATSDEFLLLVGRLI